MKSSISSFFQCFCNFTKWLKIDGSYNPGQNILGHLRKLGTKMHYCKLTHFLPLIKAWECCYKSHFLLPPLPPPQILIVNTAPGDEGRENASFRWAIVLSVPRVLTRVVGCCTSSLTRVFSTFGIMISILCQMHPWYSQVVIHLKDGKCSAYWMNE